MSDPWGVFEQVVRWVYFGWWLPLLLCGNVVLGLRAKRGPALRLPTVYHVAYLADGPDRVADTVVASMIERVQLRVDSAGKLYPTPTEPVHPLEHEVAALVMSPGSDTAFGLRKPLRTSAPLAELREDLAAHGLVVSERTRRAMWRSTSVVYVALALLPVAQLIDDIAAGLSPGTDVFLLCLMLVWATIATILARPARRGRPTKAGTESLTMARGDLSFGAQSTLRVALGGLAFYPDQALAEALVLPRLTAERERSE